MERAANKIVLEVVLFFKTKNVEVFQNGEKTGKLAPTQNYISCILCLVALEKVEIICQIIRVQWNQNQPLIFLPAKSKRRKPSLFTSGCELGAKMVL